MRDATNAMTYKEASALIEEFKGGKKPEFGNDQHVLAYNHFRAREELCEIAEKHGLVCGCGEYAGFWEDDEDCEECEKLAKVRTAEQVDEYISDYKLSQIHDLIAAQHDEVEA